MEVAPPAPYILELRLLLLHHFPFLPGRKMRTPLLPDGKFWIMSCTRTRRAGLPSPRAAFARPCAPAAARPI